MKATFIVAAGMAEPFTFIAQSQLKKLGAEDVVRPQRGRRIPQAMALARASHPDIELAEQQDVGSRLADQGATGIEMMESLHIPVDNTQWNRPRTDDGAAGFKQPQCLHLFHQLAVRLSIWR